MSPYVIIVAGWRYATLRKHGELIRSILGQVEAQHGFNVLLRHGACPVESPDGFRFGGVDGIADAIGLLYGWNVQPMPAKTVDGRFLGDERNKEMCSLGAHELIAFPNLRSLGTASCMRWARNYDIPMLRGPYELT